MDIATSLGAQKIRPSSFAQHRPARAVTKVFRSADLRAQILVKRGEKLLSGQPRGFGPDEKREVFGHFSALDRLDADLLERVGKVLDLGSVVELAAVLEAAGPGVD